MARSISDIPLHRLKPSQFISEYTVYLFNLIKKLPSIVWGTFAVFGILVVGMYLGTTLESQWDKEKDLMTIIIHENGDLRTLIDEYEELSELYYLQGENVRVVLDPDVYADYPDQTFEAVASMKQFQDMIIEKQKEIRDARAELYFDNSIPQTN